MRRPNELTIIKGCLTYYCRNPVLGIPALTSALIGILLVFALHLILVGTLRMDDAPLVLAPVVVDLLIVIGLAAMSAKVVTKGTCRLSDWKAGIGKYFWKILNISIVLFILYGIFALSISPLLVRTPKIIGDSILSIAYAFVSLTMYICYAAATLGKLGLAKSIRMGLKTIRASRRVFFSFVILLFAVREVRILLEGPLSPSNSFADIATNGLTLPMLGYVVITSFLSPLWFLIAFTIYAEFSRPIRKG